MTSILLEDLVATRLEEILKDLVLSKPRNLKNETGLTDKVKVFKGFFPTSKTSEKNENVPGIAVKACSGTNNRLIINFDIYVYSEAGEGHRSGLLIIEKMRREFYSRPIFEFAEFKKMDWDMLNMAGPFFEFGGLLEFTLPEIEEEDDLI